MQEKPKQPYSAIAGLIRQKGPITVAEYMDLALNAYYGSKNPFGAAGDFITAPEISQMFGEMIGVWLADLWLQTGRPRQVKLVELGPGRGTLAADVMRAISAWPEFKSAVTLHLVETSGRLRDIQAAALQNHRVEWHDRLDQVPEGMCFIIANEFFDALPIHQFEMTNGEWKERCVGYDEEKDAFYFMTSTMPNGRAPTLQAPDGSIFEISPASLNIIEEISHRIALHGGAALIMDYGHAAPGLGDTLQAVSRHQYSGLLENPGEKDITAHVDFSAFKTVAEQRAVVSGPITQGQFLTTLGIEARAQKLCENATASQCRNIMADLKRLIDPREMGQLFKVMALTAKGTIIEPEGFNRNAWK